MRRSIIALVAVLAFPAAAAAKGHSHTIAPPGDSGVQQYVETIPTAHGGQPSNQVHHHGGSGGATGTTGGGGSAGGTGGGSSISPATQQALASQGTAGQAAAALALATAPRNGNGHGNGTGTGNGSASGAGVSSSLSEVSHATSASPVSAIFKALTGSSSSGGMGAALPIILIACLLGFGGFAIARRRRTTT
jgi:hypothetical protein